jgi:hypothetical protein
MSGDIPKSVFSPLDSPISGSKFERHFRYGESATYHPEAGLAFLCIFDFPFSKFMATS